MADDPMFILAHKEDHKVFSASASNGHEVSDWSASFSRIYLLNTHLGEVSMLELYRRLLIH